MKVHEAYGAQGAMQSKVANSHPMVVFVFSTSKGNREKNPVFCSYSTPFYGPSQMWFHPLHPPWFRSSEVSVKSQFGKNLEICKSKHIDIAKKGVHI